jgi:alpha-D-ribose 1-methylphosphonate 5-triphosphate synthase subunit PhnG
MVRARAGGTGQRFNMGEATAYPLAGPPDAALTGSHQVGVGMCWVVRTDRPSWWRWPMRFCKKTFRMCTGTRA